MGNGINLPVMHLVRVYEISRSTAKVLKKCIIDGIKQGMHERALKDNFDALWIFEIDSIFFVVRAHIHEDCPNQMCQITKHATLFSANKQYEEHNLKLNEIHDKIKLLKYHNIHKN